MFSPPRPQRSSADLDAIYRGEISEVLANGYVHVVIPKIADGSIGPMPSSVFEPAVGDKVVVGLLAGSRDDMVVLSRLVAADLFVPWANVSGKPTVYAPDVHTHPWADVTGKPSTFAPIIGTTSTTAKAGNWFPAWTEVTAKPTTFAPIVGTTATTAKAGNWFPAWSEVTAKPTTFAPSAHTHLWADLTDKPATFTPSAHTHLWADLTDKPLTFAPIVGSTAATAKAGNWFPTYAEVTGKPSTFAPSAHTHLWADLTDKPSTFAPTIGITAATAKAGDWVPSWAEVTGKPASFTPSAHTHPMTDLTGTLAPAQLPAATGAAAGSMSAADKAKLDAATSAPTNGTLASRNSAGRIQVTDPGTDTTAATPKSYVDTQIGTRAASSHTHLSADITDLKIQPIAAKPETDTPSTYPLGVSYMSVGAAEAWTIGYSTIVTTRYGAGRTAQVSYGKVDGMVNVRTETDAPSADVWTPWAKQATSAVATAAANGLMLAADKAKLDAAVAGATGSTLVMRASSGRFDAADPTVATNVATKGYVDNMVWDGSDITTGTISDLRIANATSALDGLMPKTDKALLDGKSTLATVNTLAYRGAAGTIQVLTGTSGNDAANKTYVDNAVALRALLSHTHSFVDMTDRLAFTQLPDVVKIGNAADLNTYLSVGTYHQDANAQAAAGTNYPTPNAGLLLVWATGLFIYQLYWSYTGNVGKQYTRMRYNGTWSAWREIPSRAEVDALLANISTTSVTASGTMTANMLRLNATGDVSATSTAHAFQIGPDTGLNLIMDQNEILARNNGVMIECYFNGGVTSGTNPVGASSLTRKDYVDNSIATATADIGAATYLPTGSTLVRRHSSGSLQVVTGSSGNDAANKTYVDNATADIGTATSTVVNGTLARRSSTDGGIQFFRVVSTDTGTPSASHLVRKDWVDANKQPIAVDTGWQTTGITLAMGTGFAVNNYQIRKIDNEVRAYVSVTYTGATITVGADGNFTDTIMWTFPTGYRPGGPGWQLDSIRSGQGTQFFGYMSTGGACTLGYGQPGMTIVSGAVLIVHAHFWTD